MKSAPPCTAFLGCGNAAETPLTAASASTPPPEKASAESLSPSSRHPDILQDRGRQAAIEQVAFFTVAWCRRCRRVPGGRDRKDPASDACAAPSPPAALLGAPPGVRQILLNLIDNANQFTGQGTSSARSVRGVERQGSLPFAYRNSATSASATRPRHACFRLFHRQTPRPHAVTAAPDWGFRSAASWPS